MILAERLRVSRERADMTQMDVTKLTSINHKTISNWENNVSKPDPASISKLADVYGVSTDYLLGRTEKRNNNVDPLKKFSAGWLSVPISGSVAAGKPICVEAAPGEAYVDIPPHIARAHTANDFLCVIAKGESMEPTILDGDKLVFLRDSELHGSRNIHAISFDDYQYTAKFVKQEEDGTILITALNPSAWEPMMLSPAKARERCFRIYGYLVYLARDKFIY